MSFGESLTLRIIGKYVCQSKLDGKWRIIYANNYPPTPLEARQRQLGYIASQ